MGAENEGFDPNELQLGLDNDQPRGTPRISPRQNHLVIHRLSLRERTQLLQSSCWTQLELDSLLPHQWDQYKHPG